MLRHLKPRLPMIAGLALLFVGIFIGERWGLYYSIPNFDKVLHTLGGLTVAWFAMSLFQDDIGHLKWYKQLAIIAGLTVLVGVLWEFAEFAANFTRHSYPWLYHWFHGGDLADTIGDLTADLSGGVIFALWALYKERI
jgi:hypothetical protein